MGLNVRQFVVRGRDMSKGLELCDVHTQGTCRSDENHSLHKKICLEYVAMTHPLKCGNTLILNVT